MKATLNELVKSSACYGKLYDGDEDACMRCEAWLKCQKLTQLFIEGLPDTPPAWAHVADERASA